MKNYIPRQEVACKSFVNAETLAELLLDEGYVVLISKEENLYIVNYIWSERNANRNDVAFVRRDELEESLYHD